MCMEDVSHDSEMTRGTVKLGLISLKGNIKNVFSAANQLSLGYYLTNTYQTR